VKVVLHDHTGVLAPELQEYAQRKLTRLERHFGRVAEADVDFTAERKRSGLATSVCRINVHVSGRRLPPLTARESGADPQAALDLALDKIDRQVVKLKEKRTNRKQASSPVRVPPEEPAPNRPAEPQRLRMRLKSQTVLEAVKELESDGQVFHVFLDEESGEIRIAFLRGDGSAAVIEPVLP
jgi:putative sigma-54 modulation protein